MSTAKRKGMVPAWSKYYGRALAAMVRSGNAAAAMRGPSGHAKGWTPKKDRNRKSR